MEKKQILVLTGPTAVGKTALSIEVARELNCEIISCDSMQFYRGMDIGTAKISTEEMAGVPHHLLDIAEPTENLNIWDFKELAEKKIDYLHSIGKIPLITGGSPMYIDSLIYNYVLEDTEDPSEELRNALLAELTEHGAEFMHDKLNAVDPATAALYHPNSIRRVLRGLEVYYTTGKPMSEQKKTAVSPYNIAYIGLNMQREQLYERINMRVDMMIESGLIDEVRALVDGGFGLEHKAMNAIGYKEVLAYLNDEISYEYAIELIKRNSRRFAKRQLTWWRRDESINWFMVDKYEDKDVLKQDIILKINELWAKK